jgi:hypothetical protein
LTHAAFTLGLLRFALDNDRPLPGFAVLDSPLVVYEEPDAGEDGFSPAVKNHFVARVSLIDESASCGAMSSTWIAAASRRKGKRVHVNTRVALKGARGDGRS